MMHMFYVTYCCSIAGAGCGTGMGASGVLSTRNIAPPLLLPLYVCCKRYACHADSNNRHSAESVRLLYLLLPLRNRGCCGAVAQRCTAVSAATSDWVRVSSPLLLLLLVTWYQVCCKNALYCRCTTAAAAAAAAAVTLTCMA